MKHLFTLALCAFGTAAFAQSPTNLGTNAADGINYSTYNLFNHGVVSSYRIMAQNTAADTSIIWEFYTGDYFNNWRPDNSGEVFSAFDSLVDPTLDPASAIYHSNYEGQSCNIGTINAGMYYTFIVGNNDLMDNSMSILETPFDPVVIDTAYNSPVIPTDADDITITIELTGAMAPSVMGEHVFVRYSIDGFATSEFLEVTNFSGGTGSVIIPALPADTTVTYYVLSTEVETPDAATIDYFTLFFGNNGNLNYSFTVSSITGISSTSTETNMYYNKGMLHFPKEMTDATLRVTDLSGRTVMTRSLNGNRTVSLSNLNNGAYVISVIANNDITTAKIIIE